VTTLVDLSHRIPNGLVTYPGLPEPVFADHVSREAAEQIYGPGVTFQIGLVTMCTNTGTYIDVPFHRYSDGHDLADLALERVVNVPAVVLDRRGVTAIDLTDDDLFGLAGHAVLVRTDHSQYFATPRYAEAHPYLTGRSAELLVEAGVACVGIDSLNIDSTADWRRPVHSALLRADIPIVEHLTNLAALLQPGFTFTAVPPKLEGCGTFTVRAFATLP
jgi:arylformamidase